MKDTYTTPENKALWGFGGSKKEITVSHKPKAQAEDEPKAPKPKPKAQAEDEPKASKPKPAEAE